MSRKRVRSPLALAGAFAAAVAATLALRELAPAEDAPRTPPRLTEADWPLSTSESRGRDVYGRYCVGCHGAEGRGDGVAARFLDPLPRDFQSGKFKFRSTEFGELPTEADLMRTVTCGLPGSSMPGFPLVPELQRRDVVRYVIHLAKVGALTRRVSVMMEDDGVSLDEVRRTSLASVRAEVDTAPVHAVVPPPETRSGAESVARGRELFLASCAACHGPTGRGDGPSSNTLRDDRNAVIRPRDFTTGVFRAGSTPADLFVRLKGGLSGTPMPSFAAIPDAGLWDLVHYVLSLTDPTAEKPKAFPGCEHEAGAR